MPLVAMTREMGSLGKDVAAVLADRLGKRVVYHEIIEHLANKMRLRKSHVIRFVEGKANILERLTTDRTSLSIYTADETFQLAEEGDVSVIRGWGAAHLLRPVPHVICVRVCAPLEVRAQRMMERLNTGDREFVLNEIRLSEEAHGAITRRHFGINWQEPENYDLVLNTERLTVDECVDEILELFDDSQFQETGESRARFHSLALAARVRAALHEDPRTSRVRIVVQANDGTVTLSGMLAKDEFPQEVEDVVLNVAGVKTVVNRLRSVDPARYRLDG